MTVAPASSTIMASGERQATRREIPLASVITAGEVPMAAGVSSDLPDHLVCEGGGKDGGICSATDLWRPCYRGWGGVTPGGGNGDGGGARNKGGDPSGSVTTGDEVPTLARASRDIVRHLQAIKACTQ